MRPANDNNELDEDAVEEWLLDHLIDLERFVSEAWFHNRNRDPSADL